MLNLLLLFIIVVFSDVVGVIVFRVSVEQKVKIQKPQIKCISQSYILNLLYILFMA